MSRSKNDIMRFAGGGKSKSKTHKSSGHSGSHSTSVTAPTVVAAPFSENFKKHHIRQSKTYHTSDQKKQSASGIANHIDDTRSVLNNTMLHMSPKEYKRAVGQINKGNTSFKARGRMTHTQYDPTTTPPTMTITGPTKGSYELSGQDYRSKKQKKGTTGATLGHFENINRIASLEKLKRDDGNYSSDSD